MKSAPISSASAMPRGSACSAYESEMPKSAPSPSSSRKRGRSCGVEMSEDVADAGEHQHRQRVVHHRLVVHRQQLLGDALRDGMQARAAAAGQNDALHEFACSRC